jgi:hypothetical protein
MKKKRNTMTSAEMLDGKILKPAFAVGQVVYLLGEKRYAKITDAGGWWPNGPNCYEPWYNVVGDEGQGITRFEHGLRALTKREAK